MHRADRSPTADTMQAQSPSQEHASCATAAPLPNGVGACETKPIRTVGQRLSDEAPLSSFTPAQWDALEVKAVACMRAQLVRYHRGGGMEQAADWERAKTAWALIVMNRERITRGGTE